LDFFNQINDFVRDKTGVDPAGFLEEKKNQLQEAYNSVDKNQFGGALPYGTPPSAEGIAERIEPLASSVVNSLVPGAAAVSMGYKLGAPVRQAVGAGFVDDFVDNGIDSIKEISRYSPLRYAGEVFNAGVDPFAIIRGDQAAVQKLSNYYGDESNQGELNALPLDSQLFMRYLSGRGSQGLTIDQDRGKAIRQSILDQQENLRGPKREAILDQIKSNFGSSAYQRVMKGDVPVYFGGSSEGINHSATIPSDEPYRGELKNSLGSFWATPNDDGSYDIDERYNFKYAPSGKEGYNNLDEQRRGIPSAAKQKEMLRQDLSTSLLPADIGRRIVIQGDGSPYEYKLRVSSDGTVLVNPD